MHSTDYFNTFIAVAPDSRADTARVPVARGEARTVAQWQYDLLSAKPHGWTSDDLIFEIHARRLGLPPAELAKRRAELRAAFFSKGQPCLRSSPLAKTHGWGFHFDAAGRIRLVGVGTPEYKALLSDASLKQLVAMRSARAA